ncbi:MAG: glycerophosphodiester phosphodiesterase [Stellaceae bacterium]
MRGGPLSCTSQPPALRGWADAADRDGAISGIAEQIGRIIGHRGAAAYAPENTLVGLRRARALGCRWVEFDVRLTADGELILLHDERLDRTTNGSGKARSQPLAAIAARDAGAWFAPQFAGEAVPTLAQAIEVLAELGLGANVEIKASRSAAAETGAATADLLSRRWPAALPPPLLSSFLEDALIAARDRAPRLARGLLVGSVPRDWRTRLDRLGCATINPDQRRLRPAIVAELAHSGYAVLAYTVNDAARARELFAWGVTSVFSDVPDLVAAGAPVEAPRPALGSGSAASGAGS